jgi:hypothetical protein
VFNLTLSSLLHISFRLFVQKKNSGLQPQCISYLDLYQANPVDLTGKFSMQWCCNIVIDEDNPEASLAQSVFAHIREYIEAKYAVCRIVIHLYVFKSV